MNWEFGVNLHDSFVSMQDQEIVVIITLSLISLILMH